MWKNECKKFKPNIFNKNKCANCYRDRDQHSDEALEVNKATRIVSKCGYLFVAPNWDFTNPVYRTKRWQRRWFVLFDDGELTYSVDDHFDTIPQAIINLNNVFEITEADAITGNENSIAIVANDGIHFCKGTCREESRMWLDILRLFPQATVMGQGRTTGNGGRAKRSATFPGMRNLGFMSPASRFANNKNAAMQGNKNTNEDLDDDNMDGLEDEDDDLEEDEEANATNENEKRPSIIVEKPPLTPISSSKSSIVRRSSDRFNHRRSSSGSTRLNDDKNEDVPPTPPNTSPPASPYNPVKACKSPMTARPPPSPNQGTTPTSKTSTASITLHSTSTSPTPPPTSHSRRASYHKPTLSSEYKRLSNDNLDNLSSRQPRRPSSTTASTPPSRGSYLGLAALQNRNNNSSPMLQKKDSISSTESLSPSPSESRGTPDGCGLDLVNSSPELLTKKGWLMKQGLTKEWHKYWFVLQDVALQFYRDPKAESKGFLDGIIDLSLVQQVDKMDIPRNFGFAIHTFEGKNIIFSAITDGIRNNWITCLRKAANLPADDPMDNKSSHSNPKGKPPLTKRSSSFNDAPLTITTTKIVRSSTSNALIPPKVPSSAKSLNIPKLTTTPSSSNEQEDEESEDEDSTDFDEYDEDEEENSEIENEQEEDEKKVIEKSEKLNESKKKPDENQAEASSDLVVDLLETEVDSLKAKLELTQSELYTLHNSNLDLTTQLRRTQASSNSNKYSYTSTNTSSSIKSSTSVSTSSSNTKSSPGSYDKSAYLEDELAKTQKELAKQTSEILSLKNQLSLKQITLQQHLQAIEDVTKERDDALKKLDKTCLKLEESQTKMEMKEAEIKQANARCQDLQINLDSLEKEAGKWKMLYESLYLQYDNELHAWEESLKKLEKQRDEREITHGEEIRRKDRVVSDLSEQLKESEDRIQELHIDLEACKDANDESFSRLVVSMEEKFEETLKAEKEQMETAFKLKAKEWKDHDLYDRLAASSSPLSTRANSRRASLVKISSMSDLLTLKAPTLDNLEVMSSDEVKQKFIVLIDHFYAAVDEIRALRARLSKAQDQIDAMEIDKIRFEESFKRTIVMQEQQENLMSKRIQDLTNKLQVSEKTVRQLKERKHSRRHSIKHQNATQSDSGTTDT